MNSKNIVITCVFAAIWVSLFTPEAMADGPTWTLLNLSSGPGFRAHHRMVFDSWRCEFVVFGGVNGNNTPQGDTWTFDGHVWTLAATSGPSARYDHMMAFDSVRGRVVLFGGYGGGALSDTWEWDGTTWTQFTTVNSPSVRLSSDMVFDSQNGVTVLFGGYNASQTLYDDTWIWNGQNWTEVDLNGVASPSPRQSHRLAFDSARGKVVLFGGSTVVFSFVPPGDTWEWDGTAWSQAATMGPQARGEHAMAYDSDRGRTVLFAGLGEASDPPGNVRLDDTWEWDGSAWTQVAGTGPGKRCCHAMAYDSCCKTMLLIGGSDAGNGGAPILQDAWIFGMPQIDTDNDGTHDVCDGCPNDSNKTEPGVCGCDVPDSTSDSDNDGIIDCLDNCDSVANPDQADLDGDEIGDDCDPDRDGDGVPNEQDVWPDNRPGLPVDCEGRPRRDCNNDGSVDGLDIDCFLVELLST